MQKHNLLGLLVLGVLVAGAAALAAEEPAAGQKAPPKAAAAQEAVFEMREVSAFQAGVGAGWSPLARGQAAVCKTEPDKEVKAYPKLRSKRPLYGSVTFDASRTDPKAGIKFHFVLDESGEAPAEKPAAEKTAAAKASEGKSPSKSGQPLWKEVLSRLASGGAPRYDRLYFDANRDLDLTNDPVLKPMADPPPGAIPEYQAPQIVAFDYLTVEFDHGPGIGPRPFRILPRLVVSDDKNAAVYFVAAVARRGRIRVGPREYEAVLGQAYLVTGRFDRPQTHLELTPVESSEEPEFWNGMDEICALREANGQFYTISTTPTGDKVSVRPYRGEFGVFAVGLGKRDVKEIGVAGSIRSSDLAVPLERRPLAYPAAKTREHMVPVGDYLPTYLHVRYGRLAIGISENYHSDGRPRDRSDRPLVFGMKVRKDKPFVLDFSNKPEVMFVSPARHQVFKPGDEIGVAAVLVDPVLDIMIRGMVDTTRKQKETYKLPDGKEHTVERSLSLDPIVAITNSSGKKVAEGKMPFG